ncbi:MAG: transcription elongation factor GreA [Halobacteriovoraceae bacterium]|nr:transcription elongation factor GreA [Halobacteriovoraceae bacterium]
MNNQPITLKGKKKIEEELEHLIKVEREKLKKTIAEARSLGDLKENAEYHSAKEKQALVEGSIAKLQGVLANAQIIDTSKIKSDKIVFGAIVSLIDSEGRETTCQIVGEYETAPGKISIKSPLGVALLGKTNGDTVIVNAPKGNIEYEIESIKYE